jgi:membrane associated rhomboid family serine protease
VFPIKDNIPTDRFPFVTVSLIVANIVVYLLAIRHGGSLFGGPDTLEILKYGSIPYSLTHSGAHCAEFARQTLAGPQPVGVFCNGQLLPDGHVAHVGAPGTIPAWETVFTSMFMHASILHIGGNMLFLWIFGNNVEDRLGRLPFLAFYLLGGIVAALTQVWIDPASEAPLVGASGAIAAVLGVYVILWPGARILSLVFLGIFYQLLEVPALIVLGYWFVLQLLNGATSLGAQTAESGVAFFAHIGGFAAGAAVGLLVRVTGIGRWMAARSSAGPMG